MFTSRSEYRLLLRSDNADQRLTPIGIKFGCVSDYRQSIFEKKTNRLKKAFSLVSSIKSSPNELNKHGISINHDGKKRSVFELLAFENIKFKDLEKIWPEIKKINSEAKEQIEIESLYSGYLKRQREDILDFKKDEELKIPVSINYTKVGSLSNEIVEKLSKTKPRTIGAASRISGVTPAAIIAILRFVKKKKNKKAA
jgi:NAD/FAD-utilizing enzyme apparently involved in cell division